MGIKSGFNRVVNIYSGSNQIDKVYLGSALIYSSDMGNLALWRYNNSVINGKTLLYNYTGSDWNNTVYVPKVKGKSLINDFYDESSSGTTDLNRNTPFYNNLNVKNVDLQGVLFRNNSMKNAFYNCRNLVSVQNISNNIKDMSNTFSGCFNLNQNIKIPNSVTTMYGTFSNCYNLNQNIQIPSSVKDMAYTFRGCNRLNQSIQIPRSVAMLFETFARCYNFNQNIQIPSSVKDMDYTFANCLNLNQNIQIPNSVTSMDNTFRGCYKFNQNIKIPNSVTLADELFYGCNNLNSIVQIGNSVTSIIATFVDCSNLKCAYIYSANIERAYNCFININNGSTHVVIPSRYINNAATSTYKNLKANGWTITNRGAVVGPANSKIRGWDIVQGDFPNYTANGTHYILQKWDGLLSESMFTGTVLNIVAPEYYNTYGRFPVALSLDCYRANNRITGMDFGTNIAWVSDRIGVGGDSPKGAFQGCNNLEYIRGVVNYKVNVVQRAFRDLYRAKSIDVILPEGILSSYLLCYNASNLVTAFSLPSTLTSVADTFRLASTSGGRVLLTGGIPVIPPKVTNVTNYLTNRTESGNVVILSPSVAGSALWSGYNNSSKKNLFIYYTYANGVNTTTYTKFKANATYKGTSGNSGVSPMYNATSNFYVYNLSDYFSNLYSYKTISSSNITLEKYIGNEKCSAIMAKYPDQEVKAININCFNNCRNLVSLALYNKPFYSNWGDSLSGLFRNCYNLRSVQGLQATYSYDNTMSALRNVYNMSGIYENCYNLQVADKIGDFAVDISSAFSNCGNFNFNVHLGNNSTNLFKTFYGCSKLNRGLKIPDKAENLAYTFYGCLALNSDIEIPSAATNLYSTFYGCSKFTKSVKILSTEVTNARSIFGGSGNINTKDIYIPYFYNNGAYTKTLQSFVNAGYVRTYTNGEIVSNSLDGVSVRNLV